MIAIVGGGISGLIAAWVAQRAGRDTIIVEASPKLGGNFNQGGLKYIRATPEMASLLMDLNIPFNHYMPLGALYMDGRVYSHPEWLNSREPGVKAKIQRLHWHKTRGTAFDVAPTCMNDPRGEASDLAIQCDHDLLIQRLIDFTDRVEKNTNLPVKRIDGSTVYCDGATFFYDRLILTIPLPFISKIAPHARLPEPDMRFTHVADFCFVDNRNEHLLKVGGYGLWDYLYTPFHDLISRVSRTKVGYQVEIPSCVSSGWSEDEVIKELEDMFQSNVAISRAGRIPGHIVPLKERIQWPKHWLPLGRYAEWEQRQTTEKVLDRVAAWI